MKIDDLVREHVGGPIMRVMEFVEAGMVVVCRVVATGVVKFISTAMLLVVLSAAIGGHGPEDPPCHPVIEKTIVQATAGASGAIAAPFGLDDEYFSMPQLQQSTSGKWGRF